MVLGIILVGLLTKLGFAIQGIQQAADAAGKILPKPKS